MVIKTLPVITCLSIVTCPHLFAHEGHTHAPKGKGEQQFTTPHGLGIDMRFDKPRLLVCDREKRRLVHFDLDKNLYVQDWNATGLDTKIKRMGESD